ncbi:MAG: helix-turn-helix transcriptional regulator [Leptospirales bacterium]
MKLNNYKKIRKKNLKDEKLKKQYEGLEKDFSVAREVLELRKKRDLTQKELADIIGTSQPAIARLESGTYENISLSFLRKVASALGAETEIHLIEKRA